MRVEGSQCSGTGSAAGALEQEEEGSSRNQSSPLQRNRIGERPLRQFTQPLMATRGNAANNQPGAPTDQPGEAAATTVSAARPWTSATAARKRRET